MSMLFSNLRKAFGILFLFLFSLFSSQIVVQDQTTIVGIEDIVITTTDSDFKNEAPIIQISSGTEFVYNEDFDENKPVVVKNNERKSDKAKKYALVPKEEEKTVKKIKPNAEKPQESYSTPDLDSTFSSYKHSFFTAAPAQVGKNKTSSDVSFFYWKSPILINAYEKITFFTYHKSYNCALQTLSVRPPPFFS